MAVGRDRSTFLVLYSPSRYPYTMLLLTNKGQPYKMYTVLKFGLRRKSSRFRRLGSHHYLLSAVF